ncbi:hypothetical protein ABZ816_41845 [Actinosynnema sp. NPDC047251]|uniref:hypothetical protein n=1 Tax=Saccharothrix espanaensis TaxID=103731 RepID=UPI00059DC441|nr:hypothetical protein [Saccharothrix espanaensis]
MRVEDFFGVDVDLDEVLRWKEQGADIETILLGLRNMGCSMVACMSVFDASGLMPLSKAKIVVHNSRTWRDQYPENTAFQEDLGDILDRMDDDDRDVK